MGPFAPTLVSSVKPKLKVKTRLNLHGVMTVESATVSGISDMICGGAMISSDG